MNSFVEYLVSNWNVGGCVSIEKRYTHDMKMRVDKKSEEEIVEHVVNVGLKFYDKDNKLLQSESIKFVNNVLNGISKKKIINIAPSELENKFMAAKTEIAEVIMEEYYEKLEVLNGKVRMLKSYCDVDSLGCTGVFRGERIEIAKKGAMKESKKSVKEFDM